MATFRPAFLSEFTTTPHSLGEKMKHKKDVLLLFDIDGTMIHQVGRSGITSNRFAYAVNKVFNTDTNIDMLGVYEGRVDTETLLELAEKGGIRRSVAKKQLNRLYYFLVKYFRMHLKDYNTHALEGVKPLLSRLHRNGYVLGLVTGNIKPIAQIKLNKAGIKGPFDVGAFGDVSGSRKVLLDNAIKQANRKFKTKFIKGHVVYFGDTPNDIAAAKKAQIKVVSIATGRYTADILKLNKSDYILKSMSDTDKVLKIIEKITK